MITLIGINVTGASINLKLSSNFNPAAEAQGKARTDRRGQKAPFTLQILILVENSIDGRIHRVMSDRSHLTQIFDKPAVLTINTDELPDVIPMNCSIKPTKGSKVMSPCDIAKGQGFSLNGKETYEFEFKDDEELSNNIESPVRSLLITTSTAILNPLANDFIVSGMNQFVRHASS